MTDKDSKNSAANNKEKEESLSEEQLKINNCNQEINTLKEQLLRINADFQNYKKRIEKERAEWLISAEAGILIQLLPIVDDFERALDSYSKINTGMDAAAWLEGFNLIYKNLQKILTDLGVTVVDCSSDFNPDYHEALMQVESADYKSGKIINVLAKGYMFKGKVLRHAKVSVAK